QYGTVCRTGSSSRTPVRRGSPDPAAPPDRRSPFTSRNAGRAARRAEPGGSIYDVGRRVGRKGAPAHRALETVERGKGESLVRHAAVARPALGLDTNRTRRCGSGRT